ncbi:hypothetical protein QWA_18302 [Alcaligenes faecalis subsp. faecalis NCIB 8687]|nr:hypothetical protein QWA_18302 [Alcaligenes faecalis subsp. faecalis NCIB 8687]
MARLRLAGILLEQKEYDEALAQGQNEAAREAWKQAVELLKQDPISQLVQIKLDALAGA